jgi:O-antigen/teichoic acid export membrane protein
MFIFYRHVFVSIGRVSLTWRMVVFESAWEAGASIALVLLGSGAAGAAFGRGIGYLVGVAFGVGMISRALGGRAIRFARRGQARRVARYGSALLLVTIAYTLFEQIGVLLIGAFIGTHAVGIFEAPNRLMIFLSYGGSALAAGIGPRLARRGDEGPDARSFTLATRALLLLQGALLAPVIVWAKPISDLVLGSGYSESIPVLRALAPFMFLLATGTFLALTVNFVGEAKRRIWIAVLTVAICATIDIALLPTIGVVGAAIGMDVAFAGYVLGHYWICRRVFEFPVRRLLLTLGRCLLAAAVMGVVLAFIGTSSLAPWQWVAGGIFGALAYVGALIASGELTRAEIVAAFAEVPWSALGRRRTVS